MLLKLLLVLALVPLGALTLPHLVRYPLRTILPAYVFLIPIGGVLELQVPLPAPFNTATSLLGAGVIGACLAHVALYRRGGVPAVPLGAWLLFLAWGSVSAFWAIDPSRAFTIGTIALPLILLMLAVSLVRPEPVDVDVLRLAVIGSGILVGVYAFALLLTGSNLPSYGVHQRFHIENGTDPNILAASLLLPLTFSLERLLVGGSRWFGPGRWRMLGTAGAFFTFVAILLTGSRGGALASVAAFIITLISCRRLPQARPWIRRTMLGFTIATLAVPAGILVAAAVNPRGDLPTILSAAPVQRILNPEGDTSGRREIWTAGVIACKQHCAIGAGFGNFPAAFDQEFAFSGARKSIEFGQAPHNVFLGLSVETGLIGLTLFGLALTLEWRALSSPRMRTRIPALRAGFAGILIANIFLSAIWFKYFWLPFTLARIVEAESAESTPA